MNIENDTLGLLYTTFLGVPEHKKYEVVSRIKRLVNKKPELKANRSHPVFISAIEWHISNLKDERQTLQDFFNKRTGCLLDGFDSMPNDSISGFRYLNEKIAERISEINDLITGYEEELEIRKLNK